MLHQQINIVLTNKFGSIWRKSHVKNCSNTCKIEKFNCIKEKSCRSCCKVIIDHSTQIATIYWNEMQHDHLN